MSDKIFAQGIFFDKPSDKAPEFVKGKISFKVEEAVAFLQENTNSKGYVNLDLLKSQAGKLYLQVNDWEPEKKEE